MESDRHRPESASTSSFGATTSPCRLRSSPLGASRSCPGAIAPRLPGARAEPRRRAACPALRPRGRAEAARPRTQAASGQTSHKGYAPPKRSGTTWTRLRWASRRRTSPIGGHVGEIEPREVLERIHREAGSPDASLRFVRVASPGMEIRQGDVYLYPIEPPLRQGGELATRQLAPGTTAGSRHVIEGDAVLFQRPSTSRLDGPWLYVRSRAVLVHPEHAHVSLPKGWYAVAYQVEYATLDDRLDDGTRTWSSLRPQGGPVHD